MTIDCPLCRHDESTFVVTTRDFVYRIPGEYTFVRCLACGHLFINPRPTDDVLMECYPEVYGPHVEPVGQSPVRQTPSCQSPSGGPGPATERSRLRRWAGRIPLLKRFAWWLGQQHATVMPEVPLGASARLLEVGCAHGGYLAEAAAAGWTVDGIEPNRSAAERARARGLAVHRGTLDNAAVGDASREAIVAWMVLEHVSNPREFVEHAFRILTAGGVLCLSVPNAASIERRMFGRFWLGYDAPRHLQLFTAGRLRDLLREQGFVEIKIVHQASLRYWWGSLAAWGNDRWPEAKWPRDWMRYFVGEPPRWMKWLVIVPEKLIAAFRTSGRITVTAVKPR